MKAAFVFKNLTKICLAILFVAAGIVLLYSRDSNFIKTWEISTISQIRSVMSTSSSATNYLKEIKTSITDFINLNEKYKKLQIENQLLKDNILMFQQLYFENEALRKLNHLTLPKTKKIATTRIVSQFENAFANTAIILAGKKQHIEAGQVVVNGDGVVGKITIVGDETSRILLLTDASSKIPVFFPRTQEHAVIIGNNYNVLANYLPQSTKVITGDLVVTSGDGSLFPYGLPVGMVSEAKKGSVMIRPFYDQHKLDLVTILSY